MLSRPVKIGLGAAAAAGGLWWLTRDRRIAHASPAVPTRLRGDDTVAARVSNAGTVVSEHASAAASDLKQQASEVASVVGTHAKLAGRDIKRTGAEVSDALTGDLKAVKVRDTPPLVGGRVPASALGDVDRTRNAAVYPASERPVAGSAYPSAGTYSDASSTRGRPYAAGSAAVAAAPAFAEADAADRAAMVHVPQVEDALGESAMAINAVEGPGSATLGSQASLHYGARDATRYGGDSRFATADERYAKAASGGAGVGSGSGSGYTYNSSSSSGVSYGARASNAKDIAHDHATAARADVRQAKRELSDIGATHGELMKRDLSTAGAELKQALTGDALPGGAIVRDTPDLTRHSPRDVTRAQATSSTFSPYTREAPTLVDRLREAKDIVKAHGAAAVDDAKQWGHEVKEVVAGHGSVARADVANAGAEVKDASRGAIAPAAPLRTPAITAEESKRF